MLFENRKLHLVGSIENVIRDVIRQHLEGENPDIINAVKRWTNEHFTAWEGYSEDIPDIEELIRRWILDDAENDYRYFREITGWEPVRAFRVQMVVEVEVEGVDMQDAIVNAVNRIPEVENMRYIRLYGDAWEVTE